LCGAVVTIPSVVILVSPGGPDLSGESAWRGRRQAWKEDEQIVRENRPEAVDLSRSVIKEGRAVLPPSAQAGDVLLALGRAESLRRLEGLAAAPHGSA
jgi:hypothetical protein